MAECYVCGNDNVVELDDHMDHILMSVIRDCPGCGYHYNWDTGGYLESLGWFTLYNDRYLTVLIPWLDKKGCGSVWHEFRLGAIWLWNLAELYYRYKARLKL